MTHSSGRITKAGRKDLRRAMVNAANQAAENHPHLRAELERLEPHLSRSKAIVTIARKLLVTVWHVLTKQVADRFADLQSVARSFINHAYNVHVRNLPEGESAPAFAREQLDLLGIGKDLQEITRGSKHLKLPPSKLLVEKE